MAGNAIMPISTTDAPMMPVDAAITTPMIATAKAYPPDMPRNTDASDRSSRSAIPDRSSISPMNTKSGIATSSQLASFRTGEFERLDERPRRNNDTPPPH